MVHERFPVRSSLRWIGWMLILTAPLPAQQEIPSALSGFQPSELYDVVDESPFSTSDEFMIRLLFRSANASSESWDRYATFTRGVGLAAIEKHPQKYRFQVFELKGRVKWVCPVRLPEGYGNPSMRGFYLVRVKTESGDSFVIAARSVPRVWPVRTEIDEPIRCRAFFQALVDFSNLDQALPEVQLGGRFELLPLFITDRVGWYPDQEDTLLGVGASAVLLAGCGVDIGQFDFVKQNNNRSISESDSNCFFQLLAAANRLSPADFKGERLRFVQLLENPQDHFGEAVQFTGHVKRAVRIYIDRKAVRERLGLDFYYELDMFVPLGDNRVVIQRQVPDAEAGVFEDVVYRNRFPATVCVPRLPGTAEEIRGKRVTIDGFFMKFWNYDSEFTSRLPPSQGQISPLVIAIKPRVDNRSKHAIDNFLLLVLVGAGIVIVGVIWFFRRSDEDQKNPVRGRLYDEPNSPGTIVGDGQDRPSAEMGDFPELDLGRHQRLGRGPDSEGDGTVEG
ncbi:MAG: hypothetical protein VYE64_08340 [Planctomycetota bacterium]|nr:hypothetical protein [Planctomycetota bacterium]